MNRNDFLKAYLRQRGKRVLDDATKVYKHDVYSKDAMSEAEIQQRVDQLDIQDLDETVKDSGADIKDEPKDDDKPTDDDNQNNDNSEGKFPQDLGHGVTLLSVDNSNDYKG